LLDKSRVLRQLTKVARVVLQSIPAIVKRRNHHGDHLALWALER
jgi:hypothetical protein